MRKTLLGIFLGALFASGPLLAAEVKAENVWLRATAPGQTVAGVFMDLTADRPVSVLRCESPASDHVELHTMSMQDGMMVMRRVSEIKLPRKETVQLKPGGLHVMLIGIKGQLKEGDQVPVTLHYRDAAGKMESLKVSAAVRKHMQKHESHDHLHR